MYSHQQSSEHVNNITYVFLNTEVTRRGKKHNNVEKISLPSLVCQSSLTHDPWSSSPVIIPDDAEARV